MRTRLAYLVVGIFCCGIFGCLGPRSAAAGMLVPEGLEPGASYHLAFVTEGRRDGTSTLIEDYNAFVSAEATRIGAITEDYNIPWFAMASTELVDARDNAPISGAVYLVDGTFLADGPSLWLGELFVPFGITQFGTVSNSEYFEAFTGGLFGFAHPSAYLGSSFPRVGSTTLANEGWSGSFEFGRRSTASLPFFAISGPLMVPPLTGHGVPEPGGLLVATAFLLAVVPSRPGKCRR